MKIYFVIKATHCPLSFLHSQLFIISDVSARSTKFPLKNGEGSQPHSVTAQKEFPDFKDSFDIVFF